MPIVRGYKAYAELSSIPEAEGVVPAVQMIEKLLEGHEAVVKTARASLGLVQEARDEVTLELLTQRLQVHEKTAWMLRSMLLGK